MKKLILSTLSLVLAIGLNAQVKNDGGTIVIENGATLVVESDIINDLSGTITNSGTIEVKGDFNNVSGTINSNDTNSLIKFSGDADAEADLDNTLVKKVEMAKTGDKVVTLTSDLSVTESMTFTGANKMNVDGNTLTFTESAGAIVGADANNYIISDASVANSVVRKEFAAGNPSNFVFEVGDDLYAPVDVEKTAGGAGDVDVATEGAEAPNKPLEATDFVERYWNIDATAITGFEGSLAGTYNGSDATTGTAASISGAAYDGSEWTYDNSAAAGSVVSADVDFGDIEFTGTNKFGKIGLTVVLDGPYNGTDMNIDLNTQNLIPLTSPYGTGEVVTAIPANVVDWVLLETRQSSDNTVTVGSSSAFLKNDGSIVNLSGSGDPLLKDAPGTGWVVVKHRNHLGVCTGTSETLDGSATIDFSDSAYTPFGTNAMKDNSGTMTLWAGDSNSDGEVKLQGTDNDSDVIKNAILADPGNFFNFLTYTFQDYIALDGNMNGTVALQGSGNDKDLIKNNILAHPGNFFNFLTFVITEQIPN